jgi:signal transduction histidine kinase/CheY-like chemotaxis protein
VLKVRESRSRESLQVEVGGRWLDLIADPVLDDRGDLTGIVHVIVDITERRLAQEALQEADRRKDRFLATLAHELRNPLAPIRNAVEILKLKGAADPAALSAQGMIERQLAHMVQLIDDLLDVGRIAQGKLKLRPLTRVLDLVLEAAAPLVERAGHRLVRSLDPGPIPLDGDPVRLAQVLHNLLDNACKYTERGGEIRVSAGREGPQAVVRVGDTGIGIAPEHLTRVFEMFSQPGPGGELAGGGLGIGLSLAQALVALHGGEIEAGSAGPGRGSELTVRLPLPESGSQFEPAAAEATGGPEGAAPRSILVVDDNPDIRESLSTLLRLLGHRVETAGDGLAAVDAAARVRPDTILLDLGMPVLDGCGACRRIRAEPWGQSIRIVALTGWGQDEDRRRTRECGFDLHLVKPVAPEDLARLLAWPDPGPEVPSAPGGA